MPKLFQRLLTPLDIVSSESDETIKEHLKEKTKVVSVSNLIHSLCIVIFSQLATYGTAQ